MALGTPHEIAIDIALIDALHAFSNDTGKAATDHNSGTERGYQDLPTPSTGVPLDSIQTCEAVELDVALPQVINGMADADEGDSCPDPRYMGHGQTSV